MSEAGITNYGSISWERTWRKGDWTPSSAYCKLTKSDCQNCTNRLSIEDRCLMPTMLEKLQAGMPVQSLRPELLQDALSTVAIDVTKVDYAVVRGVVTEEKQGDNIKTADVLDRGKAFVAPR